MKINAQAYFYNNNAHVCIDNTITGNNNIAIMIIIIVATV